VAATPTKAEYYQGMTSDRAGHLFFDGLTVGGYRTDLALNEQARNDNLIPPDQPFNHIGDWTFDSNMSHPPGRLILPLECFQPGGPNGGNTCGQGAFGVADPATITWQYRVLLDQADIAKAMWAEMSPDGSQIWTSSGNDLLAYATADVNPANAGTATIHPVRRLAGAVPPSGITGAVFDGPRLLVAGQNAGPFQIWSIDLATGARRLETQQVFAGESEGLDRVDALGGELHWQVQPLSFGRPPTFASNTIVSFVRRADARIRLRVTRRTKRSVTVRAALRFLSRDHPLAGARVTLGRSRATTNKSGLAVLRRARGRAIAVARKAPLTAGRLAIR
jgi:hypothetical protein